MSKLFAIPKDKEAIYRKLMPAKLREDERLAFGFELCQVKTIAQIKSKNGRIIPEQTTVMVVQHAKYDAYCFVVGLSVAIIVNWSNAHKYLDGFQEPPTLGELEYMAMDSVSTTPYDNSPVEHDGTDQFGFKSWVAIIIGI